MLEFNESLVAFDLRAESAREVIEALAAKLCAQNLVSAEYGVQTWAREIRYPTGLPTKPFCVALPHAEPNGVNQSSLAVAHMHQPVKFQNMADPDESLDVMLIFMLAYSNPEGQVQTLKNLSMLLSQPEKLIELRSQTSVEGIETWLRRELQLS